MQLIKIVSLTFLTVLILAFGAVEARNIASPNIGLYPSIIVTKRTKVFEVKIKADSRGNAVTGVDVYKIHFDPRYLQVMDADPLTGGVQIRPTGDFGEVVFNHVDNQKGEIAFSRTVKAGQSARAINGEIGVIKFEAANKKIRKLLITIDYKVNSTDESNLTNSGDILSQTIPVLIIIR